MMSRLRTPSVPAASASIVLTIGDSTNAPAPRPNLSRNVLRWMYAMGPLRSVSVKERLGGQQRHDDRHGVAVRLFHRRQRPLDRAGIGWQVVAAEPVAQVLLHETLFDRGR